MITGVFPTHVGVIRLHVDDDSGSGGIPHACGGDPKGDGIIWFKFTVFPTHVGVIPLPNGEQLKPAGIPHACGGDPKYQKPFCN